MIWLLASQAMLCGCLGGVYFAFSAFVMTSLSEAGPYAGPLAMVAINRVILASAFMPAFLISVGMSIVIGVVAMFSRQQGWFLPALTASGVWLVGMFAVTAAVHVPMNDTLAAAAGNPHSLAVAWKDFASPWTRWNHLRTAAALSAAALYFLASLRAA